MNENICILRQDKGRGVVIIDILKYTQKFLKTLDSEQFV